MKRQLIRFGTCILLLVSQCGFADETSERIYLSQMLNQLKAMQPLIVAAAKSQSPNTRIQFHYSRYRDINGQMHNGLLDDVQAIEKGIEEKLDGISLEPRVVAPLNGDYLH